MSQSTSETIRLTGGPAADCTALLACPFCGTKRSRVHEWFFGAVIICECGGRGPEGYGQTKIPMACDLWNMRKQANAPAQRPPATDV
jgi:hypothetical protein